MNESSIRNKTLEITEAYISLLSNIDNLSLQDFLSIRELAVKELERQAPVSLIGSADRPQKTISVPEVSQKDIRKIEEEPIPERPKRKIKQIKPKEEISDLSENEETVNDEPSGPALSKFEMLKAFPDEWN